MAIFKQEPSSVALSPIISVITVNYNDRKGLERTVESVLNQSYRPLELVVVDGLSTDGSRDYLQSLQDPIVKYISEPDQGIYDAMQKGLSIASGDAVIFLNAGDWFFNDDVLTSMARRVNVTSSVVLARTAQIYGDDIYIRPRLERLGTLVKFPAHQGVIVPMSVAKSIPFDQRRYISADTSWILQCIATCNYVLDPCILSYFELGGTSNATNFKSLEKWVREAMPGQRVIRLFKAALKWSIAHLVGKRLFYRMLYWHRYEHVLKE
jgi:glycosyltransferase involved in cell wall biosynthesis